MNGVIVLLLKSLGRVSQVLSLKKRRALGRFVGSVLSWLSGARRRITASNIMRALPDLSEEQRKTVAKGSWHNLGITLVELLAFPKLASEITTLVSFENKEVVQQALERGRGVVFVSAHFGNWEALALSAPVALEMPLTVVVKPQRNSSANVVLNSYRELTGNTLVDMDKAARAIVSALSNNKALALLADQSASMKSDVFVEMFGIPTLTYKAPAALALRHRSALIVGFATRTEQGYSVELKEIEFDDIENSPEGIVALTQRHVAVLEGYVRRNPDHWVWQHKRWKHQPQDSTTP